MASITIKNIPEEMHQRLKLLAKEHGRSLNQEILQGLQQFARQRTRRELDAELARVREHHRQMKSEGFWTTPEEVEAFIQEGRD